MSATAYKFIRWVLIPTGAVLAFLIFMNAWIDPLWVFRWDHRFNQLQEASNERRQKAGYLEYRAPARQYDGVILGSSRVTFIHAATLKSPRLFNFGVSSLEADEVGPMLEYYVKHQGQPSLVVLGLDFESTRTLIRPDLHAFGMVRNDVERFWYVRRTLLSMDVFRDSFETLKINLSDEARSAQRDYYFRNVDRHLNPTTASARSNRAARQLDERRESFFGPTYKYRADYTNTLSQVGKLCPQARILVFTTPVSADLFRLVVELERGRDFERWLRELVAVFGEVYDTMGITPFTTDPENYYDAHHFYPAKAAALLPELLEHRDGIGRWISATNIESHLQSVMTNAN